MDDQQNNSEGTEESNEDILNKTELEKSPSVSSENSDDSELENDDLNIENINRKDADFIHSETSSYNSYDTFFSKNNLRAYNFQNYANVAFKHFENDFELQYNALKPKLTSNTLFISSRDSNYFSAFNTYFINKLIEENNVSDSFIVNVIPQTIHFNIYEFIKKSNLQNTIIVFYNCLRTSNKDFYEWFELTDFAKFDAIAQVLKRNNIYITFFNEVYLTDKIKNKNFQKYLFKLNHTKRLELLEPYLFELINKQKNKYDLENETIIDIQNYLLDNLDFISIQHTPSEIEELVDMILKDPSQIRLNIKAVIQKKEDLRYWFNHELNQNSYLRIQSLAFAITQTSTKNSVINRNSLNWFTKLIEDKVFNLLIEKNKENYWQTRLSILKSEIWEKCRVEEIYDEQEESYLLQFKNTHYTEEIWKILNQDYYHLLDEIADVIESLVFENNADFSFDNRILIGRILAKIAEYNHEKILLIIRHFSYSNSKSIRAMVGRIVEGMFEHNYSKISKVENLIFQFLSSNIYEELWSGLSVTKVIGIYDSKKAIKIINKFLNNKYSDIPTLCQSINQFDAQISKNFSNNEITRRTKETLAYKILNNTDKLRLDLLQNISYSLVAISILRKPSEVLNEINKILISNKKENDTAKLMYTLIMLDERRGWYFDELIKYSIKGDNSYTKAIKYDLMNNENAVVIWSQFFVNLFSSIKLFPNRLEKYFKDRISFILLYLVEEEIRDQVDDEMLIPKLIHTIFSLSREFNSMFEPILKKVIERNKEKGNKFNNELLILSLNN